MEEHVSASTISTKKRTSSKFLDMVIEAILINRHVRGTSVPAIKGYIQHNYPETDLLKLNINVKKALLKGINENILVRPKTSEDSIGATGRFKVNKTWLTMIDKPKKTKASEDVKSTKTATKATKTKADQVKSESDGPKSTDKKSSKPNTTDKKTSKIKSVSKSKDTITNKKKVTPKVSKQVTKKVKASNGSLEKPAKKVKPAIKSIKKTGQLMTPVKKSTK